METLITAGGYGDLHATGQLRLNATIGGLVFRFDPATSEGYVIELQAGSTSVLLKKWLLSPEALTGRPWFRMEILQRGHLPRPVERHAELPFDLILSLGDVLNYCAAEAPLTSVFEGFRRNLAPGGLLIAETSPHPDIDERLQVQITDTNGTPGAPFPWARLGTPALLRYARTTGWHPIDRWSTSERTFVSLRRK